MILCFCVALCLLLQARKLSLQQLHTMSDEEWRSLKLPVVRHYCITHPSFWPLFAVDYSKAFWSNFFLHP